MLYGQKKEVSLFKVLVFITNNFVSVTVHVHLLCHPKGLVRAGTLSLLSAVQAVQRAERSTTAPLQK